jgi:outer membrane murein-binding lipoprotein Lpp
MPSINDVVNVLKSKVDELGSFIAGLQSQVDAARADALAARSDLALAQLENHDLRNQLQAVMLPVPAAPEYDPAADLRSVIEHLDVLMGRGAAPVTESELAEISDVAAEPAVVAHDLTAPVEHVEEAVPLEASPLIVEASPAEPAVEAPVEPTLTLVTAEPVAADSEHHEH